MRTDDYWNNTKIVTNTLSEAAIWEQLAEECSELSHAALKMARKLRNENPTPLSKEEIKKSAIEEYTDVLLCANTLRLKSSINIMDEKLQRWVDRITEDKES